VGLKTSARAWGTPLASNTESSPFFKFPDLELWRRRFVKYPIVIATIPPERMRLPEQIRPIFIALETIFCSKWAGDKSFQVFHEASLVAGLSGEKFSKEPFTGQTLAARPD
jgi:hypothetical protein